MKTFTRDDVIREAKKRYKKKICLDNIDEYVKHSNTLQLAVDSVLMESAMWDSTTGDPFDLTNIISIPY
jgi:hypothetical protein